MSHGSSNLERRQQALRAVRRHVRRLEIETHRVKAHLARLEADYEEDVADWMSRPLRRRLAVERKDAARDERYDDGENAQTVADFFSFAATSAAPTDDAPAPRANGPHFDRRADKRGQPRAGNKQSPTMPIAIRTHHERTVPVGNRLTNYRKSAPSLLASLAIHAAALVMCISFGFATVTQQAVPLFASPNVIDPEPPDELAEVEIEPTKFDDSELQNVLSASEEFNIADNLSLELQQAALGAGTQPLGDLGQLDALPQELGALMAGAGSPGGGRPGGEVGDAVFFGARSKGDRFVFVVDNSSSMKGGRLEAATAELMQAVEGLSPRQSFYVIFVSDQTYPMFYPAAAADLVPATAPNKKRLADWLPKAILASGNNRKLIEAMDLAASLRPHAVFLLWDGDMRYSDKVRRDVMTHLTRPNQWNFAVHTLGMGVVSLDARHDLAAIAAAHGGTFTPVDVPAVHSR
jgi:hypothetical protein